MIDDQQLVAPKPDVNYGALSEQPSPEDFFLLSRVKGPTRVAQLCTTSGMGRDKTLAAVEKLLRLGLLHTVDESGKPIGGAAEATRQPEPQRQTAAPEPSLRVERNSSYDDGGVGNPAMLGEPPSLEMNADELGSGDSDLFGGGQPEPQPRPQPKSQPEPQQAPKKEPLFGGGGSSFNVAPPDDEDDLFMPSSPAHVSRVEGKAPVKRDRADARVSGAAKPQAQAKPAAKPAADDGPSPTDENPYPRFPSDFTTWKPDESDFVEGADRDLQREVLFVHAHLDEIDYYQLFGVGRDADRRAIKKTYFKMSKRFHPDKFFRDDVGELAGRVEDIFKFVTKGYQTLSKKNKRAEYDSALAAAQAQQTSQEEDGNRKREMAAEMLRKRAEQLTSQGEFAQAADQYRKVAALLRDHMALLEAASLLLRANQRLDEAAKLARGVASKLPDAIEPRLVLGQIYEKNDMLEQAAAAFAEAESISPGDPAVRVHLERVKSQLG